MELSFSLPLAGESINSDEYSPDDAESAVRLRRRCESALSAGADMIFAPTKNITHKRLDEQSRDEQFPRLCREAVGLTAKAAGEKASVGGLIAPSGILHYTSGIFEGLYFDYLEKITVLRDAGADFILLSDAGTLGEMRAAVFAANAADIPIFITMTVDEEGVNRAGTDYIASLITLQSLGAAAFGISCSEGNDETAELIAEAFPHAELPLIAIGDFTEEEMTLLSENGADIFILSRGTLTREKAELIKSLPAHFEPEKEKDSFAAAVDCEAFFLPDDLVMSEPIECTVGLEEDIIDLDDEAVNSVFIELHSADDASLLADNANITRLPVTVHANDSTTLEAALRYFQGRLIVDTRCDIDKGELEMLASRYGAILY